MKMNKKIRLYWIACILLAVITILSISESVSIWKRILEPEPTETVAATKSPIITLEPLTPSPNITHSPEPTPTLTPILKSLGTFRITAYCPCKRCSEQWGNRTSTGVIAKEGRTIAVDPKVIPYGTIITINGKEYVAEDCGGKIKEKRIDIYFENHSAARQFGVQYIEVYIKN